MQVFLRLLHYIKGYRGRVAAGIAATIVIIGLDSVQPLVMRYVIDDVLTNYWSGKTFIGGDFGESRVAEDLTLILWLTGALFGLYVVRAVLNVAGDYLLQATGQDILFDLRTEVYDHLQKLSLRFYNSRSTGEIMSRVTSDVESLQNTATDTVQRILVDVSTLIILGGLLFTLDWRLAAFTLAPMVVYGAMIVAYNRKIRPLYTLVRERLADISAILQDNITGIRVIKCFAREDHELERFIDYCRRFLSTNIRIIRARVAFFPLTRLVISLGPLAIIYFGGSQVLRGTLTIGTLVAFQSYLWRFYRPVGSLTRINDRIIRATASARRVFELLDTSPDISDRPDAVAPGRIDGQVELDGVTFGYDNGPHVLKNVTIEARPGQLVGLVGPSGAGKSTIINLICRFYDPDEGVVRVDGTDVRTLQLREMRKQIGLVLQDPFLFNGTIRENIAYGRLDAGPDEIIEAAVAANAHDFICSFRDGYDTRIGERGVRLSGGEKQRLSIARAILNDPRILILDEATSSVDTETEVLIQNALNRLLEGRTTFAIAHRLSTVRRADRLYVVDRGEIIETGTHGELLAAGGLYAHLCDIQFALEDTDDEGGGPS